MVRAEKTRGASVIAIGICALAGGALLLKLFTFEFYFADDPTSGVALRMVPRLENRQRVSDSKLLKGRILVEDENGFLGEGLYRGVVGWAWLPLVLCAGLAIFVSRKTRRAA